jgi:bifunctional non-homologous end joining protein LigD
MPASIEPMLATPAGEPFDSREHIFELMWGGLRAVAHVRDAEVHLRARNGRDLTPYFPELRGIPDHLGAREAILDGEIVAADGEGVPSFDLLRPRLEIMAGDHGALRVSEPSAPAEFRVKKVNGHLSYQVFDILWLDGRPLHERPLWQRKNRLAETVRSSAEFAAVDFVNDEGVAFFEAVVERRLEGVVAKQKASVYTPGRRARSWLELRALQAGDFVVGGYAIGGTRRKGDAFAQLLLGTHRNGRLEYAGGVSGGLSNSEARRLVAQLEPLHTAEHPFHQSPPLARLIYWTRPEVVVHVRFSEWAPDGTIRFPIFSAPRPDLVPGDCTRD